MRVKVWYSYHHQEATTQEKVIVSHEAYVERIVKDGGLWIVPESGLVRWVPYHRINGIEFRPGNQSTSTT